jgi:gamma-glutamylcyclotransferase (GGCT)/AIG2-like uncharacterized protein YtfP
MEGNISNDQQSTNALLPVFIYGTLMSSQLLAGAITGDERQVDIVEERRKRATLHGYSRHAIVNTEYPAVIKGKPEDRVEGYLYFPRNLDDIRKLDNCEDESYVRDTAEVIDSDGQIFQACLFVWCDELDELLDHDWNFEGFESRWVKKM